MRLQSNDLAKLDNDRGSRPRWRPIGDILVSLGALEQEATGPVLERQRETGKLYGETAVELGLVPPAMVQTALECQYDFQKPPPAGSVDPEVVAAFDPHCEFAERLRAFLLGYGTFSETPTRSTRVLTIAGIGAPREASLVAANLGVICAQSGQRVLIVDANVDHPIHNHIFRSENRSGLMTLLSSPDTFHNVVQRTAVTNLGLIPTGPSWANASAILEREPLIHRLLPFTRGFDIVFIDCGTLIPPLAAKASMNSDGTIVVVKEHESSLRDLRYFTELLRMEKLGAPGVIMLS